MGADASDKAVQPTFVCPDSGAAMIIIEILARKQPIRAPPGSEAHHECQRFAIPKPPANASSARADTGKLCLVA